MPFPIRPSFAALWLAPVLLLAGCDAEVVPSDPDISGMDLVVVESLECGDNCYVWVRSVETGMSRQLLCDAPLCGPWVSDAQLPPEAYAGQFRVRYGTAAQVDGSGTVMDPAFPALTVMIPA